MANPEAPKTAGATPAQEIAQDLDELRTLAARFRHLAPTAGEPVLRAILLKREALLGSISARVGRLTQSAKGAPAPRRKPSARRARSSPRRCARSPPWTANRKPRSGNAPTRSPTKS